MARLDKLIQLLHDQRAGALRLAAGQPAALQTDGRAKPVTRDPLTGQQIVALVREIAPAAMAPQVKEGATLHFSYGAPAGPVDAELSAPDGTMVVTLRPATTSAARSAGSDEARGALDILLRARPAGGNAVCHHVPDGDRGIRGEQRR